MGLWRCWSVSWERALGRSSTVVAWCCPGHGEGRALALLPWADGHEAQCCHPPPCGAQLGRANPPPTHPRVRWRTHTPAQVTSLRADLDHVQASKVDNTALEAYTARVSTLFEQVCGAQPPWRLGCPCLLCSIRFACCPDSSNSCCESCSPPATCPWGHFSRSSLTVLRPPPLPPPTPPAHTGSRRPGGGRARRGLRLR